MKKMVITLFLFAGLTTVCMAEEWDWDFKVYGVAAGMDGDVTARGVSAPVDLSPSDVLEDLEFTAQMSLDVRRDSSWGVITDVIYMELGDNGIGPMGRSEVNVEQWLVSLAPYVRVVSDEKTTVDLGAGARFMEIDLDVSTPANDRSQSQNWWDALILSRVAYQCSEKWSAHFTGIIGGFGAESDLIWELIGALGYEATDHIDLLLGYRYLDVDYDDGAFAYDVATSGAFIGARFSP